MTLLLCLVLCVLLELVGFEDDFTDFSGEEWVEENVLLEKDCVEEYSAALGGDLKYKNMID